MSKIRNEIASSVTVIEVLKKKDYLKTAGVIQLKMLSEIALLLSSESKVVPLLVQKVSYRNFTNLGSHKLFTAAEITCKRVNRSEDYCSRSHSYQLLLSKFLIS